MWHSRKNELQFILTDENIRQACILTKIYHFVTNIYNLRVRRVYIRIAKLYAATFPNRGIIGACIIVTMARARARAYTRTRTRVVTARLVALRALFSGFIGIGKSVVLIPLLKQSIITHSFRIGRASWCTSLQRHRHNGETLQAAARPGTDGISKCSSAVFEFAVPSWINYRADSYTTGIAAKARAREGWGT